MTRSSGRSRIGGRIITGHEGGAEKRAQAAGHFFRHYRPFHRRDFYEIEQYLTGGEEFASFIEYFLEEFDAVVYRPILQGRPDGQ